MTENSHSSGRPSSVLILFPEIFGVTAAALTTPVLLWRLFTAGHTAWAIGGLACWLIALYFTIRLAFRRQYALAFVSMLAILVLCLLLLRVVPA